MLSLLTLFACLVGVSSFQGLITSRRENCHALKMDFKGALGAQAPLGFWDPLGFLKDADQERFDRLRNVEIKHGRISMLAILGHLVTTSGSRLPGNIAYGVPFTSVKNGLAAFDTIPAAGVMQLFLFIGLLEIGFANVQQNIENDCSNYMTNSLRWSEAKQRSKAAIELNNGRAAQMGILALMVHEKLNNDPYIINTLLGAPVPFNP